MNITNVKKGFTGDLVGTMGGKVTALFLFVVFLAVGAVLSILGFMNFSRAAYSASMVTLGYIVGILTYDSIRDWFSPLVISSGLVVGLFLFIPGEVFLGVFLYALGFGLSVSRKELE